MEDYKKLFLSKDQYWVDTTTDFHLKIPEIVALINVHTGINFDWNQSQEINRLSEEQLVNIQKTVTQDVQSNLVSVLSPYIEPHLEKLFGERLNYEIRVSAQVKGRWNEDVFEGERVGKWVDGIYFEDESRPNLSFPTRPHQDLDNNGNRGSHTLIFYFQLTLPFTNSSLLEYAQFKDKIGLLPFQDSSGYSNEIMPDVLNQLQWQVAGLNPGDIALMTGLTVHRSTSIAEIPRVALNVKIQPTNLDYLELIYGYDLSPCQQGKDVNIKLSRLYEILKDACQENRLLLFETAVTALLLGKIQEMQDALKDLCLFAVSEEQMQRIALGAILRQVMINVKRDFLKYLSTPLLHIEPLSCGASILETIGVNKNSLK